MNFVESFKKEIHSVSETNFNEMALDLFGYQYESNEIYRKYCQSLKCIPKEVSSVAQIPFLPIEFFKLFDVKSGNWKSQRLFRSSGTTGTRSKHHLKDESLYQDLSLRGFELCFGDISQFQILAVLPSYEEQGNSSLVFMVNHFVGKAMTGSGFFRINDE